MFSGDCYLRLLSYLIERVEILTTEKRQLAQMCDQLLAERREAVPARKLPKAA